MPSPLSTSAATAGSTIVVVVAGSVDVVVVGGRVVVVTTVVVAAAEVVGAAVVVGNKVNGVEATSASCGSSEPPQADTTMVRSATEASRRRFIRSVWPTVGGHRRTGARDRLARTSRRRRPGMVGGSGEQPAGTHRWRRIVLDEPFEAERLAVHVDGHVEEESDVGHLAAMAGQRR